MTSYQVEFAYNALEEDELALEVGDIIKDCLVKEDGWLEGELKGKRGMFPDNFVKKVVPLKNVNKAAPPPVPKAKPKMSLVPAKMMKAVFSYRAANEDEISFDEGTLLTFLETVEDGWARGKLQNGKMGLFPTNFVEAVADPEQSDGNIKASPISKNRAPEVEKDTAEYYKVAFDYQADNSDELSLTGGDVIKILTKESADEGWWNGENVTTGKKGVFPKKFSRSKTF